MKGKEDPGVRRSLAVLLLLGIFAVGGLSSTRPSSAETLVQQNVDTRVVLAFRVGHATLQRWLPAAWQIDPAATGPSKGASLTRFSRPAPSEELRHRSRHPDFTQEVTPKESQGEPKSLT
jgi:hypothetical protein